MHTPEVCPNCGTDVPRNAKACPECGSCEETGWSEEAASSGLDLPDDEFNYDDFVAREFGEGKPRQRGNSSFLYVIGILVVVVFLILLFTWK